MNNDVRKYRRCIETSDIRCHVLGPQKRTSQHNDTVVIDEHPFWNSFADGFVKGFTFPFAVLFGMAGCTPQSNPPIIIYDDTSDKPLPDAQDLIDGGVDATSQKETAAAPIDVAPADVGVAKKEIFSTKPDLGFVEMTDVEDAVDSGPDVVLDLMADAELDVSVEIDAVEDLVPETMSDVALDIGPDVESDTVADVADVVTPETITDTKLDVGVEDAAETVDAQDTGIKDSVADSASDVDAPICQYFCDAGKSETTDTYTPKGDVVSNLCGPLLAPQNSVAAACTNEGISVMLQGAKSCVAECGFYDDSVILSTSPTPVKFSMNLFKPIVPPMQPYTVSLSFNAPILSNGTSPTMSGFMNSSLVFTYQQGLFEKTGVVVWTAQAQDKSGNPTGKVGIVYEPYDFIFGYAEFLDIIYTKLDGTSFGYRYPCDTLSNPIVQCADVAPFWKPVPSGEAFCTAPQYNTILKASGAAYFSPMCVYLDTMEVMTITKDANGKKQIVDNVIPLDITQFNVNFSDLSDVALKSSTTIFVKFNALLPTGNKLPLDPSFTSGNVELGFTLDPIFNLTWDPIWIAKDPQGHEVNIHYNPTDSTTPAYLSVSYVKGAGLVAFYTFPCVIPNASAPIDYSKSPGDYVKCPQKAVKP